MTAKAHYYPQIFDAPDMQRAREIILTNEGPGADTESRWAGETPYVLELIRQAVDLEPRSVVLDYGCGLGRLSKAMIDAAGCSVIGLDISTQMLNLGQSYVQSERFIPVGPAQLDILVSAGLRVDAVIAVWVLQHCFSPATEIERMRRSLAVSGRGFVLNMRVRAVPAVVQSSEAPAFHWANDQQDVAALLRDAFEVTAEGLPDATRTPNMADAGAFWMSLKPRTT